MDVGAAIGRDSIFEPSFRGRWPLLQLFELLTPEPDIHLCNRWLSDGNSYSTPFLGWQRVADTGRL